MIGERGRVRVLSHNALREGDEVVMAIGEGLLLRGALMVYWLPLAMLFSGALLGADLQRGDGNLSMILGALGLLGGFLFNRWYSRRHGDDESMHPRVVRVLSEESRGLISCQQQ